jgi:hypothetical protein
MSVQHANRGIVKKDLQLYYNREYNGSFLGEATMNFFSIPVATLQKDGNHSTSFGTNTTSGIPDLIVSGNKQVYYVPEYYTLVATGAWQAEVNRLIIYPKYGGGNTSYAPSGTYRISFYARSLSGNTALGFAFYSNNINNTATLTNKWQRFSANSTYSNGAMIIEFGNLNAGSMVCQIACIQVEAKSYATPFTVPVLWTPNLVNVTSTSGHTKITRGATNNNDWTQARIFSSEGYSVPCYMSFKASQTGCPIMIGLNSDPGTGINYANLDYAWYVTWDSGNPTYIYENGTPYGPYAAYTTSTILEIIYDGANVNYYLDGTLIRSVARSSTSALYLDSSFYSTNNGGAINNLSFGPLTQINRFSNYKIGGGGLLDISGNNVNADLTNVSFDSGGYSFTSAGNNFLSTGITTLPSNTQLTIDVWTKPTNTTQARTLVSKWGSSSQNNFCFLLFLNLFAQGNIYFLVGNSVGNNYSTHSIAHNLSTSVYSNFTIVYDNGLISWYRNGVFVSPSVTSANTVLKTVTTAITIGADFDGGNPDTLTRSYDGIIPNVRLYSRPLTAAEVLQNFNATRKTYGI